MTDQSEEPGGLQSAQVWVMLLVIALACGAVAYRFLMREGLGHSGAMFIGIPAILAILLACTPKAKTVTGGILKGITLALLLLAPILGEGYLCILMASPLFYFIGICIGIGVDSMRRNRDITLGCIALLVVPMSLEGVTPTLSFNRTQSVQAIQIVDAPATAVKSALAQSPHIATPLPRFLRIGFPHPLEAHGGGLAPGSTRSIFFSGAEGDPPGYLDLQVAESRPGYVRFVVVHDASKLTQWIQWKSSEVEWAPVDATHTRVTWRIRFDRQLDPAWYFTPWERFAVTEAADYLIRANTIPEGQSE